MPPPGAKTTTITELAIDEEIPRRTLREDFLILTERLNLYTIEVTRRFEDLTAKQEEARQRIRELGERTKRIKLVHERLTNAFS
jgi:hypothetical protein